ncbi:hypothetical protein F2Q69_00024568 [Brassica cretica]|uniref:Uncharacterized protein n=1 Tax=Brassica cretica TaxID=69181 RepID=A0A8S9QPM3_BRACR|nr:hypothetical protein F2Q69_00024568 [Brassica cretica]
MCGRINGTVWELQYEDINDDDDGDDDGEEEKLPTFESIVDGEYEDEGASCSIMKCSGALGSVLERPAVSSMIRYTTLMYVLRDSPQRSVHLAVRAWEDLLETAARAGLTRRDPQRDEPATERDVTGQINPFDIYIYNMITYVHK